MRTFLHRLQWIWLCLLSLTPVSYGQGQTPDCGCVLYVFALDGSERTILAEAWAKLPHASVQVIDHDGKTATFDGEPAREVLKFVNAPLHIELRGKNLSGYLIAQAADGLSGVCADRV